jgi:hypothetical protein
VPDRQPWTQHQTCGNCGAKLVRRGEDAPWQLDEAPTGSID